MSRRRLACEPLEDRQLLATLDLRIGLYSDDGGSRGSPIAYARVGDTFLLSVITEDQRPSGPPAGIIALPLDLQWRTDIIRYPSDSPPPPPAPSSIPLPPPTVPNAVLTASFPLQRFVSQFNVGDAFDPLAGKILGLRGTSLPAAGLGQAIGIGAPDPLDPAKNEFSLLQFEAVGAGLSMPFQMTLAGSMSFADGGGLESVADADPNAPYTVTRRLRVQAVVGGRKFEDLNGNGLLDAGEPGLPGWEIRAYIDRDGDGVLQQSEYLAGPVSPNGTATTDADGTYQLALDTGEPSPEGSCPAGTPQKYILVEVAKDGWTQSFPRDPQNDVLDPGLNTGAERLGDAGYAITIQPCDPNNGLDNLDFGNFQNATKSGVKFEDLNGNGVRDAGEPVLPGWTIQLTGTDGLGNSVNASATTGSDGGYRFSVPPGTYTVYETLPTDWHQSSPRPGTGILTAPNGTLGYQVTLTSGQVDDDNHFGNYRKAIESGLKFEDSNGNGARDAGEFIVPVWPIHLTGTDGLGNAVELTTTTGSDGTYSFSVPPGVYTVYEELTGANWHQSFPRPGPGIVTGPNGTLAYQVTLVSGQLDSDNDFGNYCDSAKSGVKFEDQNGNGVRDTGEPGRPGWTIRLIGTDGLGNGVSLMATTGSDGGYFFSPLPPGTYTVYEDLLDTTWKQSFPQPGAGIVTAPNGTRGYQIIVVSCQIDSGADFGNFRDATKSGLKFEDLNGNGVLDSAERGLQNWSIHLDGTDGLGNPVNQTVHTDGQGRYSFSVPPGIYTVSETLQSGWTQTAPATGSYFVTLSSGQIDSGNDFGNHPPSGSLSGFVYADVDKDAVRDVDQQGVPVELGLPQVEIALWRNNQVVQTDWTGPDGWYHFEDLEPGTYDVVQVTQPACFIDGTESLGIILPGKQSRGTAGADRLTGITINAGEHGIDYNFGELGLKAVCINKGMFFGSTVPRQDTVYTPLGVSSAVVRGTPGDDQIAVETSAGAIRVTVNGGSPQTIATADATIVVVDAGAGRDAVTASGSTIADVAQFQPTYGALRLSEDDASSASAASAWDSALEAVSTETFLTTAAAERDALAVLRDSPGSDQLNASGDAVELVYVPDQDLDLIARAVVFDRVRAISAAGGDDAVHQTPPVGMELQLLGDWQSP